jgi:hypothetical protein
VTYRLQYPTSPGEELLATAIAIAIIVVVLVFWNKERKRLKQEILLEKSSERLNNLEKQLEELQASIIFIGVLGGFFSLLAVLNLIQLTR